MQGRGVASLPFPSPFSPTRGRRERRGEREGEGIGKGKEKGRGRDPGTHPSKKTGYGPDENINYFQMCVFSILSAILCEIFI